MTDLDELLADTAPAAETALGGTATPRKHRHQWVLSPRGAECVWCGIQQDPIRSRRGKSSARLGKDQERRIERLYGPRKVGEFGDAIDLLGRDWKWQSKATRTPPPFWLVSVDAPRARRPSQVILDATEAMLDLQLLLYPLVIVTYVDRRTRDWIWVRQRDWAGMHGRGEWWMWDPDTWLVMSGIEFLTVNGRDEPA